MMHTIIKTGVDRYEAASAGVDRIRPGWAEENCGEGSRLAHASPGTDVALFWRRVAGKGDFDTAEPAP